MSLTECLPCPGNTLSSTSSIELCSPCPTGKYSGGGAGEDTKFAAECSLDVPVPIFVSGMCPRQSHYNGLWVPVQKTASDRFYFEHEDGLLFLFWDPSCDGVSFSRWIFEDSKPSITAENDLDGE